jgi:hypothetical protein
MLSSARLSNIGRRCFSTSLPDNINVNHPRVSIAKNVLKLRRIAAATCETTLRAALADPVTVEQIAAQPDLTVYEARLLATTVKTYHAPYVPSPHAWQNWHWAKISYTEMMKLHHYGFMIGFM